MTDGMTDDEKRRDQLLAAPGSTEADAAPRIDLTDRGDGITRIVFAASSYTMIAIVAGVLALIPFLMSLFWIRRKSFPVTAEIEVPGD